MNKYTKDWNIPMGIKMIDVFRVPASVNETKMALFVIEHLIKLGLDYDIDNFGNISVKKGEATNYPMFCAHLDTVHTYNNGYFCKEVEDIIFAYDKNGKQVGVGGDDLSGIYVCLKLLEVLPVLKVVFFSREETGGIGSRNFNTDFLKDCRFIGGVDRRGIEDFVTEYGGKKTVSDEFLSDIKPLLTKYNRKESTGMFTDAFNIKVDIPCFNMSAAYYQPHTDKEVVKASELEATYKFCLEIAKICTKAYKYERPIATVYNYTGNYGYQNNYKYNKKNNYKAHEPGDEWDVANQTWVTPKKQKSLFPEENTEKDTSTADEEWRKTREEYEKEWNEYYERGW